MKEPAPAPETGRISRKNGLPGGEYFETVIEVPGVAGKAKPGQFVHIRLPQSTDPLLRRPFSIAGAENGKLTILFKKVGRMTAEFSLLKEGAELDVLGPLGNGYDLGRKTANAFLVAGGYGIAPLLFLGRAIRDRGVAGKIVLIEGARNASQLVWAETARAESSWLEFIAATDDGSVGRKGNAVEALADALRGKEDASQMFACGPMGMLAAMHKKWPGVPFQCAVENQMGCGIGVCQGCVLPLVPKSGQPLYTRICHDGPVYEGSAIDWDKCPK
jgi:dihydroorotate dehydrogenase electron transfer subunit